MVTIPGHFNRKIFRWNSSPLAPYAMRKIVSVHSFFKQISRPFDDHNSPQQSGSWKVWQWIYACCAPCPGCIDIKSVWKQSQMIITQEPNQTQNQLRGYGCTRARVILLLHKDLDYTKSCQLTLLLLNVYYGLTINDVQRVCLRQ